MKFFKIITLQLVITFLVSYSASAAAKIPLTPEEAIYLQKNPVINMCVDPDWLPYEKLDVKGRHIGLVVNYMGLLQARLKVRFNVVPTTGWQEAQSLYEDGFCDIVSALNKYSCYTYRARQ